MSKKLQSTEACREERLGMPVFIVFLARDEREKSNSVRKGSAFSYNV